MLRVSGQLFGLLYAMEASHNHSVQRIPFLPGAVNDPCTLKPDDINTGMVALLRRDSVSNFATVGDSEPIDIFNFPNTLMMDFAARPIIDPSKSPDQSSTPLSRPTNHRPQ